MALLPFLRVQIVVAIVMAGLLHAETVLALEVPPLTGRIVDRAHLLSPEAVERLSQEMAEHERKTGNQVAVLTLSSLEGESLEAFSHRVATTWRLGQKGTDNGVLLLVVPTERRLRIEVGYGLEGTLTDAASGRIIRHVIVPAFRAGRYSDGIVAGVRSIIRTLERGEPEDVRGPVVEAPESSSSLFMAVLLGALIGGVMFAGHWKGVSAVISMLVSFLVALPHGVGAALIAALLAMIVGLVLSWLLGGAGGSRRRTWGGPGPMWGGGYGGGFSPSDTFRGGGGDFGGGGASGRW